MKKWVIVLIAFQFVFNLSSCTKNKDAGCTYSAPTNTATAAEISFLQSYVTTNSIPALQHSSGVFYTIDAAGSGNSANVCSNITVNYTGSLLSNGYVFDSNTSPAGVSFTLGQLIAGWQTGLPLISRSGIITLYIPPSLGYGATARFDNNGNVIIPANSYLKFNISLKEVQ